MPIATWRDEYNINVEDIDTQHKEMLELVNKLHASVEACIDKNELKEMLIELADFTRMHFSTEEKYMKKHDYPGLKKHHKEHKVLLKHMSDLVRMVSSGKYPTFYSDYDVSSDWALIHIFDSDKKLGEFLNSKGIF